MSGDRRVEEDERRFRRVFADHYRAVLAYALRRCDRQADADDVVAQTFATAWRRFADAPGTPERMRPWLFAIAARVLANERRSRRRWLGLVARVRAQPSPPVSGADEAVGARERQRELVAALLRLPERDQEILRLAGWERLEPREIGQVLGCSANAASIRLHRARKRLAAELAKGNAATGHEQMSGT